MAWIPVTEAAVTLGVSERTVQRRIKAGTLSATHSNGRTLVDIDEQPDRLSDAVGRLTDSTVAGAVMRRSDQQTLEGVLSVMSDYRTDLKAEATRARWAAMVGIGAAISMAAVGGFLAVGFHDLALRAIASEATQERHRAVLSDFRTQLDRLDAETRQTRFERDEALGLVAKMPPHQVVAAMLGE
jgi:excisionase family DNA binding protein